MKKFISVCLCLSAVLMAVAADPGENRNSPLYFGPNALPVPDMLDGTVQKRWYAEVDYDFHHGFYGDATHSLFFKLNAPLFTPRVNLSLWVPIEWYNNTPESIAHQKPVEPQDKGFIGGNIYVTTDIHLLLQTKYRPDIAIRAALVTASGDSEEQSRYFDSAGYFFDASIAKSVWFKDEFFRELRLVVNGGFLCWTVDKTRQNDAYMYGLKAQLDTKLFTTSFAWQGYSGWIGNGDKPMVIKADCRFRVKKHLRPLVAYEYGIRDYPFHHFRVGVGYEF